MKTFLTALLFGPIAMILIPSIELVTIMANYKKTMLILISVFFTASHSFMSRAQDQEPSSSINCTIKAYRPRLCGVRCDDIIQKGPFEITYQSNDPKITIFQGEIEGKPVKFTFAPLDNFIVGTFDSGEVITVLNRNAQTLLMYKDYSGNGIFLNTMIICE